MRTRIVLAGLILAALLVAPAARAADLTGTWIGKTEVPQQGTDTVTLVLKKARNGAYEGTISDSLSRIAADTAIKNVKWEKDVLTCSFPLADGAIISLTCRLEGDKLSGNWVHEQGDSGSIVFEKAAKQGKPDRMLKMAS